MNVSVTMGVIPDSEDETATTTMTRMMPKSVSNIDVRSFRGGPSSVAGSHRSDDDGRTSASSSSRSKCTLFFFLRILDTALLLMVCIGQGSLLNFLIIWHRQKSHAVYLWFLIDFAVVMAFVGALTTSYQRMARRFRRFVKSTIPSNVDLPIYGALPLGYLSWFLYSSTLVAKVVAIFIWQIDDHLGDEGIFDTQILKMVIGGGACLIFVLLVNAHQVPSNPNDDRRSYMAALCTGTAFEIFDSIAFIELLFVEESRIVLPFPLENAILALSSINLILPTFALLRLSLADFGNKERSVVLGLIYSSVKLLFIEIPFLVIRAYLWQGYGATTSSIFMLKNILMIVVKLRYILPEYIILLVELRAKQKKMDDTSSSRINVEMNTIS